MFVDDMVDQILDVQRPEVTAGAAQPKCDRQLM
jgi:hypothetical protein